MRFMNRHKAVFLWASIGLLLTGLPSFARQGQDASQQSTGDPVADAARKARAKKKQEADKPKKVYTDDDLNHAVPDSTATTDKPEKSGTQGSQPAGNAEAGTKPADSPETIWRKRFKEAYANLNRAEKELDILQREVNKAETQYYPDPQKALEEQYTRKEINDKDAKIAAKKKEVASLKQHISDLEDELRKAGGDPGWANP